MTDAHVITQLVTGNFAIARVGDRREVYVLVVDLREDAQC